MKQLRIPNLLLLGAQKSASTYLGSWLNNHPDIYVKTKEDRSFEDPEYKNFDLDSIKMDISEKYYAIRRPEYFGNILYQERIHKWLPNASIIIILRNPIDRAYSAYYHYMRYGVIPVKNANYIHKIIKGNHDKRYAAYKNILEYGKYYKLLTHLLNLYKKENILLLKHEEIQSNATFLKIAEFLNISNNIPERPIVTPQKSLYHLNRLKLRSLYYPFKMNYDNDRSKAYTLKLSDIGTFKALLVKGITKFEKIFYKNSKQKDLMNEDLRSALKDYYREDIHNLKKLDLIDVSNWLD